MFKFFFIAAVLIFSTSAVMAEHPKAQLKAKQKALKEERAKTREAGKSARQEEMKLRGEVKDAMMEGDKEKAKELRDQWRSTHKENREELKSKREALKEKREELQEMRKEAHKQWMEEHPRARHGKKSKGESSNE